MAELKSDIIEKMNKELVEDVWQDMTEVATRLKEQLERQDLYEAMILIHYLADLGEDLRKIIDDSAQNDR